MTQLIRKILNEDIALDLANILQVGVDLRASSSGQNLASNWVNSNLIDYTIAQAKNSWCRRICLPRTQSSLEIIQIFCYSIESFFSGLGRMNTSLSDSRFLKKKVSVPPMMISTVPAIDPNPISLPYTK